VGVERFVVKGGARLVGEVQVSGAKNSVLKLMAASLLAEGTTTLTNVPDILDVEIMSELLRRLGCTVTHSGASVAITVPAAPGHEADYDLVRRMRASITVLGPLLARCGQVKVALPGGDAIGSRGLDMHVAGLEKLGATATVEHGYLVASAPQLVGAQVWLDFPSVGATETLVLAAVLAQGTTVIDNAAREPDLVDLCEFLVSMGAKIGGIGSSTLEVQGVTTLSPTTHATLPDRIVAGTWAVASCLTMGDIRIAGGRADHLENALDKLVQAGASIESSLTGFRVRMTERPKAVDVVTLPYPGFPTDLQPMVLALNAVAEGTAMVTENVFEARWMFVNELARLGADIRTDGHHAVVRGKERLSGAPVTAHDIRAGAALVLAGLVAEGVTEVYEVHHVDRGYEGFTESLVALGADVQRLDGPEPLR
jgi:UDP-N-acetylglucosamine 1-carboxyvinyltransferase